MRKFLSVILLSILISFIFTPQSHAFEITSDPQYVVINFSDSFHFLDWTAREEIWQKEIKPQAAKRLRNIKTLLTTGTPDRRLAWSTLMEYTNYPLDKISDSSPYIIRLKRMMELAESEDLPIFIPLNGIQWWDELPELWNWWDFDGNQTPGCTNDNYATCGFVKLRDPKYRQRFIKGYNPENKWNVDWQDWETPMKFAVRNWGSGDILVAPSPNIVRNAVQKSRFEALIKAISSIVKTWESKQKQYLFAGLSVGTEVTLNQALRPGDTEFIPYGYRAIQDTFCPKGEPTCGRKNNWTQGQLEKMREEIIFNYFNRLALMASKYNLPKERIYTHVWSEASPDSPKYTNSIAASITYFSRPGMSLYGKALDPLGFPLLHTALTENGYPGWAAPEFAPLVRDSSNWSTALSNTLDNSVSPAKLIDIYNEADILKTPAIPVLKSFLTATPSKTDCFISESIPETTNYLKNPSKLIWKNLETDQADSSSIILWSKNKFPGRADDNLKEKPINDLRASSVNIPGDLERGFYYWAVKRTGCQGTKWTVSTPHVFFNFPPLPKVSVLWWVGWINKIFP